MNQRHDPILQPLSGLRVLDLTRYVAGPYCTMLLGDQGAEVIKIEPPGGEETREIPPELVGPEGHGVSVYFARFNRNKQSVCIDLKKDRGREAFERLVANADILVENFRPGVLSRLGFPWERLEGINPQLIYCSISGFGHAPSEYRSRPAFAPIAESMAGVARYNPPDGDPPILLGISVGDLFPGALAVGAISMALLHRKTSGEGSRIDMSMYDAMVSLNERSIGFTGMLDVDVRPGMPTLTSTPSGIYEASDGFVCFSVVGETIWARFCEVVGREDLLEDPRLTSGPDRAEVFDEVLMPVISDWLKHRSREQAVRELLEGGVPAAEVMSAREVVGSEHARTRGMVQEVPTFAGKDATVSGNPIRLSGKTPPAVQPGVKPIPGPGEQSVEVLRNIAGLEDSVIEELIAESVVTTWPSRSQEDA